MKKQLTFVATLLAVLVLASCSGSGVDADISGFGNSFDGTQTTTPAGEAPTSIGEDFSIENLLSKGLLTEMQRVTVYDEVLGCEAMRSTVSDGWLADGQVYWTMQSGASPAIINFYAYSPDDKARSGYVSRMSFSEPDPMKGFAEGQYNDNWLPSPMKRVMSPEAYLQEYLAEYFGASSVELLDVTYAEGDFATALQQEQESMQATLSSASAQANAMDMHAQSDPRVYLDWAEVELRLNINGVAYRLQANCMVSRLLSTITTGDLYSTFSFTDTFWDVGEIRYYIAEESVYDDPKYKDASLSFQHNLILNRQWDEAIAQTSAKIFEYYADMANKNFQQIQAELQQQAQQIAAQSYQNYSSSSSSGGSSGSGSSYDTDVMGGWTNVLTGQSYYEAPDGGSVLLDYNDYHYTDGSSIYSSSTPINTGGTNLSPLTDLGTMGGD